MILELNGVMVDGECPEYEKLAGAGIVTDCGKIANAINFSTEDLTLKINSYGGSVEGGTAIAIAFADFALAHPENKIKIEIGAICASAAANLVARMPKQATILVHPESMIMYHSCNGVVEGTPDELRDNAKRMDAINELVKQSLKQKTTLDEREIDNWFMTGREGWLTGMEAVQCGLADGFIDTAFSPMPIITDFIEQNIQKTGYADIAAIAKKSLRRFTAMDEEKKIIETEIEAPETEKVEEKEIEVEKVEEVAEETDVEETAEETEIEALKAENEELKKEIESLKATCEKLTQGLKSPTAKAVAKKTFAELVKEIPTDISGREYAERFTALKKAHKAEYDAYMQSHSRR